MGDHDSARFLSGDGSDMEWLVCGNGNRVGFYMLCCVATLQHESVPKKLLLKAHAQEISMESISFAPLGLVGLCVAFFRIRPKEFVPLVRCNKREES